MTLSCWGAAIPPVPNELLSNYLCRVAVTRGMTPYGFCESELDDPSFWTRDGDRGVIPRYVNVVAERSGLSVDTVQGLTLRSWLDVLAPPAYVKRRNTAVIPWVNVVGLYHRMRVHHGLQYCPLCLREENVVSRFWRLSFVVQCPVHDVALRDACPHCDAPFVPHRAMGRLDLCHACGKWLITVRHKETVGRIAVDLQAAMLAKLTHPTDTAVSKLANADLVGLRHLVSVFLMTPHAADASNLLGTEEMILKGPRLEMSRHARRVAFMQACATLVNHWPSDFHCLAKHFGLTQRRFVRFRGSAWLDAEIAKLPERLVKPRAFGAVKRLTTAQRLEAKKPENWRALRAAALLKKLGPP